MSLVIIAALLSAGICLAQDISNLLFTASNRQEIRVFVFTQTPLIKNPVGLRKLFFIFVLDSQ